MTPRDKPRARPCDSMQSFAGTKRACDDTTLVAAPSEKRANPGGGALVAAGAEGGALIAAGPARTSDLLAPIMLLTGHAGAVLSCKFSPDGQHVLSGSHDKMLLLWDTYGECDNTMNFKGHSNAVLEVHWASDGETAFSCSADKTGALWDAKTGARIRQFRGHTAVVNSLCPSRDSSVLATASDDRSARVWDARVRTCQHTITHPYAVTATCVSHDGIALFTGSLDGRVRWYDLRRPGSVQHELNGHADIVSGLSLSHDGQSLLSNAMDNVVRCWDVKPYATADRCTKHFLGASHNYEKGLLRPSWSVNGSQVAAGSADHFVYVWDVGTRRISYV